MHSHCLDCGVDLGCKPPAEDDTSHSCVKLVPVLVICGQCGHEVMVTNKRNMVTLGELREMGWDMLIPSIKPICPKCLYLSKLIRRSHMV